MAERTSGEDQDRHPGEGQDNAGDEPAQASSSWERPGARPGNTPAKQPLSDYKKWYNSNRPGKKERQAGAKARGIPPPPGVLKGHDTKGKDSKGKGKGKEKGKQYKGVPGKGKGQPGKVGGRTPPPWCNQATARILRMSRNTRTTVRKRKVPRQGQGPVGAESSFLEHLRAGAAARRQGQEKGQAAAPQNPAGEPSSNSSTSDAEDDMPVSPVPKLGEDQDMEATKDDEATHQASKEPLLSPTEPATSPRDGSQGNNTSGKDQEEETTKPKPNPSEVTSPSDEPASPRATVEVNIGEPHPSPVSPGANQVQQPKPKEEDKQATSAKEATWPKEQATSPELVESPKGDGSSSSVAVAKEAFSQPKANHAEPDYNLTMTFTVKIRKDVTPLEVSPTGQGVLVWCGNYLHTSRTLRSRSAESLVQSHQDSSRKPEFTSYGSRVLVQTRRPFGLT